MDSKRRVFLKGTLAAGTVGVAVGTGLLTPAIALADRPKTAFETTTIEDAIRAALGAGNPQDSDQITIDTQDVAENGAVVPITVTSSLPGVTHIAILTGANPFPLVASYTLGENTKAFVATRIKMGETSDIIAVVKANGRLYSARQKVRVTLGGCGA
ncbi:sulfur-oxidizing protein SoxY [Ectothiorhodospira magna]|uniref:Sulfur-oxidizing protein SoxY n=1 Tax=Ectothiorhodospira magna TaxID=867345 RepID=A0A1H9B367_9GAMM|nr:thiosulfate oxidation carrier protein SoxY [Ectothiorhodospira magna]SEP83394.1 sulfur-oxidizing protein SoxY [Ectothiorhodospira magna]